MRCDAAVQRGPAEKSLSQNGCPYLRDSGAEAFSRLPPPTVYRRRLRDSMVVQRRGAGTTQLPRKLLHNKTACTFSYSRLSALSPHPHPDDATIATDLRSFSPSLFLAVPLSLFPSLSFSLPLLLLLPLLLPLLLLPVSYFLLFALSLRSAGRKSIGTVHLCARRWPDRKKEGETSISSGEAEVAGKMASASYAYSASAHAACGKSYESDKPLENCYCRRRGSRRQRRWRRADRFDVITSRDEINVIWRAALFSGRK